MARFDPIVKYKDEAFNILEIPKSNSALVKEHEDLVLTSADLDSLVSDLSLVGKFTRIAYNGVAGYTDLQIKIRRIAVDVTKLCRESTILVREFKLKSSTILVDLQATYQFLIDGMEDMAIVTLQSTATEAQGMAEAAERLANAFEKESKLVENAHGDTLKTKDAEKKRKDDLEEKMKRLEIERTKRVTESAAVEQDIAFHGQQYARADARHAAYETSSDGFFEAIYNFFTGRNDERIRAAREDKERHLQEMSKLRRIRSKALADIAEFSKKMENCQEESELTEAAIQSLHKAIGGLKALSNVMRRISDFWKTLELECKKLGGEDMRKMIEEAMRRPEEKRAAVWGSTSFKNKALLYYARWVALGNICGTSYEKMKLTQNELYEYLEENPTTEEARRNVRQLAIIFSKELEVEQKAIAQKESEGQREMIALGADSVTGTQRIISQIITSEYVSIHTVISVNVSSMAGHLYSARFIGDSTHSHVTTTPSISGNEKADKLLQDCKTHIITHADPVKRMRELLNILRKEPSGISVADKINKQLSTLNAE